jgi:c-di-GMP-binding flagellar brake protein YcgR
MLIERRSGVRYPIVLNARYQAVRKKSNAGGAGRTVDISSGGLLIASQHSIPVGERLEVTIDWPALLDGAIDLVLVAAGRVVRARELSFALELSRYEFRTTKRKAKAAASGAGQTAVIAAGASETSDVPTAMARFRVPELST